MASRILWAASIAMAMLTLAPAALAAPSAADKETARAMMAEGRADRAKGDLQGALKAFAAADALMHVPTTGLELARAQAAVGQLVEAREMALRVTRSPEQPNEPRPFKKARDAASDLTDDLESRIPSITITVTNVPSGTTPQVTLDGNDLPSAVLGQPRKLDPGHHVVEAKAGTAYGKQELDVAEKDSKDVKIDLPAQAPAPAEATTDEAPSKEADQPEQPPPAPGRSGLSKAMIYGGFGLAGAGVIAGGITGLLSMSQTSTIKGSAACQSGGGGVICNPSEDGDISSAKTMATVSTISFAAAGVGAAVGVIGLFTGRGASAAAPPSETPPSDPQSLRVVPWVGLGAAGVRGSF